MAKINVAVDGPFAQPSAEEVAVTRAEGHASGLAGKPGVHRHQEAQTNAGASKNHRERKTKKDSSGRAK